jgi:hypothetical protein
MNIKAIREKIWKPRNDIDAPSKGILCDWFREGDDPDAPLINLPKYFELLSVLPDHIVENLEKARLAHEGLYPMYKAGLGAEDLLWSTIVDGSVLTSSSAEAKLAPTTKFGGNYLQPGGGALKHIRLKARGRNTTLNTGATMTFRYRIAPTDVITGNIIMQSGGIPQDANVYTDTMWKVKGDFVVRSVGSAGTVFGMGHADMASSALTMAAQQAKYMGVNAGGTNPVVQTWDMNNDQYFQFTGQWSLATAYSMLLHQYVVEALN